MENRRGAPGNCRLDDAIYVIVPTQVLRTLGGPQENGPNPREAVRKFGPEYYPRIGWTRLRKLIPANCGPKSVNIGSESAIVGPNSVNTARHRPKLDRSRSNSTKVSPESTKLAPSMSNAGLISVKLGRSIFPELVKHRPTT